MNRTNASTVSSPLRQHLLSSGVLSAEELQRFVEASGGGDAELLERLVQDGKLSFAQIAEWLPGRAAPEAAATPNSHGPLAVEEMLSAASLDERHIADAALRQAVIARQFITQEQLDVALHEQEKTGHPLWRTLVNLEFLSLPVIAGIMKRQTDAQPPGPSQDSILRDLLRSRRGMSEESLHELEASLGPDQSLVAGLLKAGTMSRGEVGGLLAQHFSVPFTDLRERRVERNVIEQLPASFLREHAVIPLSATAASLTVGMANPFDGASIDAMAMLSAKSIEPAVIIEADLAALIDRHVSAEAGKGSIGRLRERAVEAGRQISRMVSAPTIDPTDNASTVQLVDTIVEGAITSHATDIHLEPQEPEMRVRFRIDGILYDIMTIPEALQLPVVSRVKVLAEMDITERRMPQDGHFDVEVNEQIFHMRVATMPTKLGEKLVLRVHAESNVLTGLKQLGLEPEELDILKLLIAKPSGMILVTGPIGSGKTTTLYAILNEFNILTSNIVTIEDPVEYRLPGINQVEVDARSGLGFADGLRSILRQDADIIMLGEIRDHETARVAVRAAMTGQQVLSTLHTVDTPSAIATLHNLGAEPYLIASALSGVVAQRLVRKICQHCRREYRPTPGLLDDLDLRRHFGDVEFLYAGEGCDRCFHTGYSGRTGIFEILQVSDTLKPLIIEGASEARLKEAAIAEGMRPLAVSGLRRVVDGFTTPDEVMREVIL